LLAAISGNINNATFCIQNGANINAVDSNNRSAVMQGFKGYIKEFYLE
jgi:hypothetical protein